MKFIAVTTQNKAYYDKLGKNCIDSFVKYWPKEITLHVFAEDFTLDNHDNVMYHSFDELDQDFRDFQETDYKKRVKIFSYKAFSWLRACQFQGVDRVIWLDSDVITFKTVPYDFLCNLAPGHFLATYMAVVYDHKKTKGEGFQKINPVLCGETGFYITNTRHYYFEDFINRYREYYVRGYGAELRRFYDGDVFGAVVNEFQKHGNIFNDLGNRKHNTIFKHTVLAEYMTHYKGKVKKSDTFEVRT